MGYIISICIYLGGLIVYGLLISRKKVKSSEDMITGGRRIPMIILVGSLLATWCGGGGITGTASVIYNGGPYVGAITFASAPIGIILLYFIAGNVRKSNKTTVPAIMEARYGKTAGIIAALCIMIAYIGVLATQLKAAANIIVMILASSGIEVSTNIVLVICAIVIVVITVGGGIVSVAYSDAISALIMLGGFAIAIPILAGIAEKQGAVIPPEKLTLTGGMSPVTLLGFFIPTLVLILGDQNMLQRFAAAKNTSEAKKSNIGMLLGEILVIVLTIGIVTQATKLYPTLEVPSNVIFKVAVDYLPFAFGALLICACVAFIITTADSFLLSASTNFVEDIYTKYINKNATDKQKMLTLRLTICLFTLLAVLMTLYFPNVLALQLTAYTMYGAAITPAILFALFSKKVTPMAGLLGIIAGGAMTIIWTVLGTPGGVQSAIVAVPASVLVILVTTLLTKPSEEHMLKKLYESSTETA